MFGNYRRTLDLISQNAKSVKGRLQTPRKMSDNRTFSIFVFIYAKQSLAPRDIFRLLTHEIQLHPYAIQYTYCIRIYIMGNKMLDFYAIHIKLF